MSRFLKSVAAGALGGLVASYVMNQFQSVVSAAQTPNSMSKKSDAPADDATVKAADSAAQLFFARRLTSREKQWAGPAVHYAFGTVLGALYGGLADRVPALSAGSGTAYGAAVWLGADEVGVPAAGLSAPPSETPLSGHAIALASHLVYGVVTSVVRQIALRD